MSTRIGPKDVIYNPVNKEKYMGKAPPVCRSSWETAFCRWCDMERSVVQWMSEPLFVPYIDKTTKDHKGMPKKRRYYPDFLIKVKNRNGFIDIWMVEIKPKKECTPPRKNSRKSKKTQIYEQKTWSVNQSKWGAAQKYCDRRGWKFKIINEDHLGIK